MPKYYCDYCDIFLTHDSPSVRKSHNEGWKHKAAVRAYYAQFEQDITQQLIDQKIKEYEARTQGIQASLYYNRTLQAPLFPPPPPMMPPTNSTK
jgi:U1 small nuclear ribonucleoprotein C